MLVLMKLSFVSVGMLFGFLEASQKQLSQAKFAILALQVGYSRVGIVRLLISNRNAYG